MPKKHPIANLKHPCEPLARLWALRILIRLNGLDALSRNLYSITADGKIMRVLGIPEMEDEEISKGDFRTQLKTLLRECEGQSARASRLVRSNLRVLSTLVGLNKTEKRLLLFAAAIHTHPGLDNAADTLDGLTGGTVAQALSVVLDLPLKKVREALSSRGILARSGLLRLSRDGSEYLRTKLALMDGFSDVLFQPQQDGMSMLTAYFSRAANGSLAVADFSHVDSDYGIMRRYLQQVGKRKLNGINILIHGRPGTGKSELARTVAADLKYTLYEVAMADNDGDPVNGARRFSAYQLSQQVLAGRRDALILFDEIEDVFEEDPLAVLTGTHKGTGHKAWINRLLEENPVPALWISNSIDAIDNAFIRRFDIVLELDHPPTNVRERILKHYLKDLPVSPQWAGKVAQNADIAPALVAHASKVAALTDDGHPGSVEAHMQRLLENKLDAMGYPRQLMQSGPATLAYRLDALNPDRDLQRLMDGMQTHPAGRFCLYGPPGTGKTEFGRYAARRLGKNLLIKRASDLLDPYLGVTEQNIASMFQQAQADEAVLLLDEADSFLRDRAGAVRSWEVTQVNELLTRMEAFDGLFICSTNLVDTLDQASLRRFDLKIRFDYLKPAQSWILFRQILEDHGTVPPGEDSWRQRVGRFSKLTPGDFATVVRRNRLSRETLTAELLLQELGSELNFKRDGGLRGIGFTADL